MIFLGLCDICGYYSQLEAGLLELGVPCTLVNAFPSHVYRRQTRPSFWIGRVVESIARRRYAAPRGSLLRLFLSAWQAAWMVLLLFWSLPFCRVYVFAGGASLVPAFDLWLLKRLGKKIVAVFHGSDARPPYINGGVACTTPAEVAACIAQAARMKQHIGRIERYADVIVNHVLSSHFHQRPITAWLNIGIPVDVSRFTPVPSRSDDAVTIVHAPTNPGPKGSALIERAIEALRREGHRIHFVTLTGRTNAEVLDAIRDCDFVVDELFSDLPMASFATEAAGFGKAAVVGLHGLDLLRQWTASGLLPPAVLCEAEQVQDAIRALIVDPARREQAGREARAFVENQWSARAVAARFQRLCDGTAPEAWRFDPALVAYPQGWGLSDSAARARIQAVVRQGGVPALQLSDKPLVQDALVRFGSEPDPVAPAMTSR